MKKYFLTLVVILCCNVFVKAQAPNNIPKEEKIAGLCKLWIETKYNFIFLEQFGRERWDSICNAALFTIGNTRDDYEYYREMQRICAMLKDGHTNVYLPENIRTRYQRSVPFGTKLIEDKVVITDIYNDTLLKMGIVKGAEIITVKGKDVKAYTEEETIPFLSASTQQDLKKRAYTYDFLLGPRNETIPIVIKTPEGQTRQIEVTRSMRWTNPPVAKKVIEFKVLSGNIGLLSLNSFDNNSFYTYFDSIYNFILSTDALIIDLRANSGGSGSYGFYALSHFVKQSFFGTSWITNQYIAKLKAGGDPDRWFGTPGKKYNPVSKPIYQKPIVWLTNAFTFSAAEDVTATFKYLKRGTVIGTATGGSTGQPIWFNLPGGGRLRICTEKNTYPDGTAFVGIGVLPDIEVKETIKDVINGTDTQMMKAIEYIQKNAKND